MKKPIFWLLVICLSQLLVAPHARAEEVMTNKLVTLRRLLASDKVSRIEIIYVPEQIETLADLTPDMLEKQYVFKLIIPDLRRATAGVRELIDAVKSDKFDSVKKSGDLRWGCSFYDEKGDRIASLYFDHSGKAGSIDNQPTRSAGKTLKCLRKICNGFRK